MDPLARGVFRTLGKFSMFFQIPLVRNFERVYHITIPPELQDWRPEPLVIAPSRSGRTCMGIHLADRWAPKYDRYTWRWPTPINGLIMTWVTGVISPYLYRSYFTPCIFIARTPPYPHPCEWGFISHLFWWRLFTPCWSGYGIRILQARRHNFHT